ISLGAGIDKLLALRIVSARQIWTLLALVRTGLSALLLASIIMTSRPGIFLLISMWPTLGLYQIQAEVSLKLERSGVPSTIHWLDLYASSDPVPSGPFAFSPASEKASDKAWWRHFSPANSYRRELARLRRAGDP